MNTNPTGLVTDAPVREAGGVPLPAGSAAARSGPRVERGTRRAPRSPAGRSRGKSGRWVTPAPGRGPAAPAFSRDAGGFPAGFSTEPPPLRFRLCPPVSAGGSGLRRDRGGEVGGAASPGRGLPAGGHAERDARGDTGRDPCTEGCRVGCPGPAVTTQSGGGICGPRRSSLWRVRVRRRDRPVRRAPAPCAAARPRRYSAARGGAAGTWRAALRGCGAAREGAAAAGAGFAWAGRASSNLELSTGESS